MHYHLVIALLDLAKIDDPVGCVGVHWAAGFWGMIATGLFANDDGLEHNGAFWGGSGELLAYNVIAALSITVWSGGLSFLVVSLIDYKFVKLPSEPISNANIITLKQCKTKKENYLISYYSIFRQDRIYTFQYQDTVINMCPV